MTRTAALAYTVNLDPRAECADCNWSCGPGTQTRDRALAHCASRGHEVRIVDEDLQVYTAQDDGNGPRQ